MLSRVAENIYWLSRYMERTNMVLRTLKTCYIAHQDGFPVMNWEQIANQFGIVDAASLSSHEILYKLILDPNTEFSFFNNIFLARENARGAQDHITRELWQAMNDLFLMLKDDNLKYNLADDPILVFDQLIQQIMLFYGLVDNTLNRNEGYIILQIGKLLERGIQINLLLIKQLNITLNNNYKLIDQNWKYLLIALNGYDTFINKHANAIEPYLVLDLLIFNSDFPYSLIYTMEQINNYFNNYMYEDFYSNKKLKFNIGKYYSHLKYNGVKDSRNEQIEFLLEVQQNFIHLGIDLNKEYFSKN